MPRCLPRPVDPSANWEILSLQALESSTRSFSAEAFAESQFIVQKFVGKEQLTESSFESPIIPIIIDNPKEKDDNPAFRIVFYQFTIATSTTLNEIVKDLSVLFGKYNQFLEIQTVKDQAHQDFLSLLSEEFQRFSISKLHNTFSKRSLEDQKKYITTNLSYLQAVDVEGRTILHFAADSGSNELVKFLINFSKQLEIQGEATTRYDAQVSPLDINACDFNGFSPLHAALHNRHLKTAEILITYGANVNSVTKSHTTPLLFLVGFTPEDQLEQLRLIQLMIENGADISCRSIYLESPLHRAAWKSSLEIVEYLTEAGANIHDVTKLKENALHYAIMSANPTIIEYILAQEIDYNLQGLNGRPLDVASPALKEYLQTYIKCKSENGQAKNPENLAQFNFQQVQSRVHRFSLHRACNLGLFSVVESLVKRRVPLNLLDENRMAPLQYAAMNGHLEIFLTLIQSSNEISMDNLFGVDGGGILHMLVRNHSSCATFLKIWDVIVSSLKTKNYDLASQNNFGATALHEAAYRGNVPAVRALIQHSLTQMVGLPILGVQTRSGDSALHYSARGGQLETTFELLKAGLDKSQKNKAGLSPIDLAKERGKSETLFLLQSWRPNDENQMSIDPASQRIILNEASLALTIIIPSDPVPLLPEDLIETVVKSKSRRRLPSKKVTSSSSTRKPTSWLLSSDVSDQRNSPQTSDFDIGLTFQEASYRFLFNLDESQFITEISCIFLEGTKELLGSLLIWQNYFCWKGDGGFLIKLETALIATVQYKLPSFLKVQYPTDSANKPFISKPPDLGVKDSESNCTTFHFSSPRITDVQKLLAYLWPKRNVDGNLDIHGQPLRKMIGTIIYPTIHEQRCKQFLELPDVEGLITYYLCSLRGDGIPSKGTLYLSRNYLCFFNVFLFSQTKKVIRLADVRSIEISKKAGFTGSRSITVHKKSEDLLFFAFDDLNHAFEQMERVWEEARQDAQIILFSSGGWISSTLRLEILRQLQATKTYLRWVLLPGQESLTNQESLQLMKCENIEVMDLRANKDLFLNTNDPNLSPTDHVVNQNLSSACPELNNALSKMHILIFSFSVVNHQSISETQAVLDHCFNSKTSIRHIILVGSTLVGRDDKIGKVYQAIEHLILDYCGQTKCKYTLLRVTSALMQMFLQPYINIREENLFRIPIPENLAGISWFDLNSVANIIKQLVSDGSPWKHYNKKYYITGSVCLSSNQIAKIISQVTDNHVRFMCVPLDRMKQEIIRVKAINDPILILRKDLKRETFNVEQLTRVHATSRVERGAKIPPQNALEPDIQSFMTETLIHDLLYDPEWSIDWQMAIWGDLYADSNNIYSIVSPSFRPLITSQFRDFVRDRIGMFVSSYSVYYNPNEYNQIWNQFQFLSSSNANNTIVKEEFLKVIGVGPIGGLLADPAIGSAFFGCFNQTKTGEMTFPEFVSCMSIMSRGSVVQQRRLIFRFLDSDWDGLVSRKDWDNLIAGICSSLSKLGIDTTSVLSLVDLLFKVDPDLYDSLPIPPPPPPPTPVSITVPPPLPPKSYPDSPHRRRSQAIPLISGSQHHQPFVPASTGTSPQLPPRISSVKYGHSRSPTFDFVMVPEPKQPSVSCPPSTIPSPVTSPRSTPLSISDPTITPRTLEKIHFQPLILEDYQLKTEIRYSEQKRFSIGSNSLVPCFDPLKQPNLVCQTLNFEQFCEALSNYETQLSSLGLETRNAIPRQAPSSFMVSFGHPQWELVQHIMWGVHLAIQSRINNMEYKSVPWSDSFFCESRQHTLQIPNKPPNDYRWIFSEFAPDAFWALREMFGISQEDYQNSLGPIHLFGNLLLGKFRSYQEVVSTGRSGSFFFKTADGKFIIKSLPLEEYAFFMKNLPGYLRHMKKYPTTLMTKFLGLYLVTQKKGNTDLSVTRFVIMENIFQSPLPVFESFDLKGSTVDRSVLDKIENWNPSIALKDKDLHIRLKVGPHFKALILEQLENDTKWLASLNVCDYSLLVGFSYVDPPVPQETSRSADLPVKLKLNEHMGGILSRDSEGNIVGNQIIFLGLIDTLTTYDLKKKGEHLVKSFIHDSNEISAIAPDPYRKRFLRFVGKIMD